MFRPNLIIVTGRPGSGKSTLSLKLAEAIRCPLISRDRIKEGIVNTTGDKGAPGGSLAHEVYELFFKNIQLLLESGSTVVAEAAFQHKLWAPKFEELAKIARVKIVLFDISAELAMQRVNERRQKDTRWDFFHNAPLNQTKLPPNRYTPPDLNCEILKIDSSKGYEPNFESILEFARSR
ncbi:MAG: AAA family ATPase [Opitutales bacterium]